MIPSRRSSKAGLISTTSIIISTLLLLSVSVTTTQAFRFQSTTATRRALTRMSSASAAAAAAPTTDNDNIVIVGGGIMGGCILYYLTQKGLKPTLIERSEIAAAASGKAGGFLARSWHSGPTAKLSDLSFRLHAELAKELGIESYRKITTLQVQGGTRASRKGASSLKPTWLDKQAYSEFMDDDTAQVTPLEFTTKIVAAAQAKGARVIKGTVSAIEFADGQPEGGVDENGEKRTVTGVKIEGQEEVVPCSKVIVATGPWAPVAGKWFGIPVPMEGIYSSSIVLPDCEPIKESFYALFCAEDENGCHLEVYPRPNGDVYMCGIGGSDYVSGARLEPGGDCDRPEKIVPNPQRISAAMKSFTAMSSLGEQKTPQTAACMRPCSEDGLPIMGRIPTATNAFLATALNCWGILNSPAAGVCMAELVTGGTPPVSLDAYDPARFYTSKKRRGKKMKDVEVGEQW